MELIVTIFIIYYVLFGTAFLISAKHFKDPVKKKTTKLYGVFSFLAAVFLTAVLAFL